MGPLSSPYNSNDLEIVERDGRVEPFGLTHDSYEFPRVSPYGKRVAFCSDDGKVADIWVRDLSGSAAPRKVTISGRNRYPIWSPDGTRIAFQSDREGDLAMFSQRVDGVGLIERLTRPPTNAADVPETWSRANVLVYSENSGGRFSLWAYSLDDDTKRPLDVHSSNPTNAVFSPDGRWLAYSSDEGSLQFTSLYIEAYPPSGTRYPVTKEQGLQAVWSPDGREVFFNYAPNQMASVTVDTRGGVTFGSPQPVAKPFNQGGPTRVRNFDITPAGKFVGVIPTSRTISTSPQILVVLNWFEELRAKAPGRP